MTLAERVLIHFPIDRLAPKGGPAGYLYNLRLGLDEIGAECFDFLPPAGESYERNKILQRLVPSRFKDLRRLRNFLLIPTKNIAAPADYSRYSAIHFHSTEDLFLHRQALDTFRGKVVLTSHSPCAYHQELISRLNPKDAERKADELGYLEQIDEYAFKRADYVVFPCADAEEPYFHTWQRYSEVRDVSKLRYLPTGIRGCLTKRSRHDVRLQCGIPDEAFVMCYVGRHNAIKGYDSLIAMALPMLNADNNAWMLVAGKEGPVPAPSHERWVEVGWTDDPHSLIAASDAFILPNRETFFDLVMLEVLSLGTPIIATRTGGNKYFEQFPTEGLRLYRGVEEFNAAIAALRGMSDGERENVKAENQTIFSNEFDCEHFARRYVDLMGDLV